jgi:hypothetical protein
MEFYLTYQGPLPPNGDPITKHRIRKDFHTQLERLWNIPPLNGDTKEHFLSGIDDASHINILKTVEEVKFAPLVCKKLCFYALLDITLLWPDEPGNIINTGDIDNRLKTLFDALTCPDEMQMQRIKTTESFSGDIFYCLLEDDKLIQSVNIKTHTWLSSPKGNLPNPDVLTIIHVHVKARELLCDTIGLAS